MAGPKRRKQEVEKTREAAEQGSHDRTIIGNNCEMVGPKGPKRKYPEMTGTWKGTTVRQDVDAENNGEIRNSPEQTGTCKRSIVYPGKSGNDHTCQESATYIHWKDICT